MEASTQIASIRIPVSLDLSAFNRDLSGLQSIAIPKLGLKPTVDHSELKKLNEHFDLKVKHYKEVQAFFNANALKPTVDLSELTFARQQLSLFKRELTDVKSFAATKIQIKAEHTIDTSRLDRLLSETVKEFGNQGKNVGRDIAKEVSNAKVKVSGSPMGNLLGGLTQGVTYALGQKIADGTSARLEKQLNNFGSNLERYITSRVGRATAYAAKDLGYNNSRELRRDVGRVGGFVDSFIDPRKTRKEAQRIEQQLSNAAQDLFVEGKAFKQVVRQFFQNVGSSEQNQGFAEAGLRVAGFGVRQAAPAIRINKDVQLRKAAKQAEELAQRIEVSEKSLQEMEKANAVMFAVGGLHGAKGRGAQEILKPQLQRLAPGAFIQPVNNQYRDSDASPEGINRLLEKLKPGLSIENVLQKAGLENQIPKDYLKFLDTAVFSGASPDIVKAAAQIKVLQNKGYSKPIYSVGYSSGGADTADLVRLAEMMGNAIKGVGIGSPMTGLANRANPNFTNILGDKDHIFQSLYGGKKASTRMLEVMGVKDINKADVFTQFQASGLANRFVGAPQGQVVANAGQFHKFNDYIASQDVQALLKQQFPDVIPNVVPPSLRNESGGNQGTRGFDFVLQQSEGKLDKELDKIQNARRNPNPITIDKTIADLEKTQKEYNKRYKVVTGSVKEELDAFLETLQYGITALTVLKSSNGMPSSKYKKVIAEMEKAGKKYYDLANNNLKIQQERFYAGQPLEPEPVAPSEIVKPGDRAKSLIRKVATGAGNLTSAGALALMNNKIASIDAFQSEGISPKIASFRDLSLRGYAEVAKQDIASVFKFLQGSVGKTYAIAKGAENFTLDALPFGHAAKGLVQNVALPAVAFNAATHMLPGGAALGQGATNAMSHAMHLPMGVAGEAVTVAINGALTGAVENIPVIGHKLAPALAQGITNLIGGAVETATTTLASAATPVIGGQALLSPVKAVGNVVIGDQSPLIAETSRKMQVLSAGIKQVKGTLQARPEQSQLYITAVQKEIKVLGAQIDENIKLLSPDARLSSKEGNQLSQLKSQIVQQADKAKQQERKINILMDAIKTMVSNPSASIQASMQGEVIDAEIVPERRALKSASAIPSRLDVTQAIKRAGQTYSEQFDGLKNLTDKNPERYKIAAELEASAKAAEKAIDDLVKSLGSNATSELRKVAGTAKGQITKASGKASNIVKEGADLGHNFAGSISNQGITASIGTLKNATHQLAQAGIDEVKKTWDIHSPSRVGVWLGRMFGLGIKDGLVSVQVPKAFGDLAESAQLELGKLTKGIQETISKFPALKASVGLAVGGFLAFQALQFISPLMRGISEATVKTALEFDSLQRSLNFIEGSTDAGASKLERLRDVANNLGTNFREASSSYVQLASATRDTPLEGVATDQIAESLNVASSAFGLDKTKQNRINTGVAQMAGKGVVSMEELRQQLGESLPGAINIAARSLGLTTQELNKLVKTGTLMTEDFLPKFSQQLKAELAIPAEEGSKSAQASFNRLNNAVVELQVNVGKGFLPANALGAEVAAKGLNLLTANAKTAMTVMGALTVVLANEMRMAFMSLVPQIVKFGQSIGLIPATFSGLSGGVKGLIPVFAEFALKLGLVAAAFKLIGDGIDFMKDKSGELRTIADTNKKSLDALKDANSNGKDTQKNRESRFGYTYNKTLAMRVEDNPLLNIPIVSQIAQLAGQKTSMTKELEYKKEIRDSQKALAEFDKTTRENITFTQAEVNSPEVKRGQELARLLNTNRSTQRNIKAVNPSNTQDLQKLKLEEADLLKQQEAVTLKTGKTQAAIAQNIANLKSVISTLENKPEFAGQLQTFKGLLSQAEQEQDALNKKINVGALEVEKFNKNWTRVIDTLADVRASIELNSAKTTASIGNQELSGNLTQGQADSQIKQVQASQQQQILQAQKSTRDQLRANLSGSDVRATFQQLGINDNTGQAQLKTIEGKITGEREKSLVAKFGEYKQLEADITQAETQIVQTKVESARQLTETAKSVNDFFRQIQNQTKDLIFTLKSLDLDTKLNNEKARIKGAMSGFYTSFVDEFVDSIIGVIELTNEKTKNLNDAANQIQQRIRGLEETQLQASELSNGLPGGNFSGDMGGAVSGQVLPYKTIATGTFAAQEYGAAKPGRTHAGQDLDLGDNDSFQSYIGGKVTQIGDDPGGYFKWIDVYNARLKRVERIAELDNVNAKVGDNIAPGQVVGKGTTSTGVVHYEIRTDADGQGRGGFGASGTEDPVAFLQKLGLVKRQGSSLIPTGKVNQGASIADDHATPTTSMGSLSVGGFDGQKIAQAVAFYISQGISKQGAAYLVGSAIQESGLKPSADNGSHKGLYQWDNNRSQGMPSDFMGQLKFSLKDLAKDSPDSLATLKNPNASASDHAKAIQNWERYGSNEAGSRYQYAEQIYSKIKGQGSVPMLPTTGQTQGSIENNEKVNALAGLWQSQLDDSTKQAMVNVQQESAALTANAQSKNKLIDAQIKDQQKKEAKKFQTSIADQEKNVIGHERTLADIRADFGDSTPFKELEKQLLSMQRQKQDNTKQLNIDYEKIVENITKAKAAIKLFDVKGATPQQKASVALLKEALPELERQEKHLKAVKDQYDKTYSAAELDKVNKFNQALYEERVQVTQEIAQSTQELARARTEAFTSQARGSLQSSQAGLVMGLSALPSTVAAERAELNQKFAELDKQQRAGSKTADEVRILKENLSAISELNLSNTIEQLRKIGEEIKVQSEATKFSNYQSIYESKSKLASANSQTYRLYGLETQASDIDKQQAVAQIDFDYVNQVRALEQMVRTTPEAAGAAKELKTNLDEIRNLNLDNVAKQFDPVTKIIGNAKEAFQGLLTDVFSGTKGFVQSISDFFLNIGNQLLGYATQYFTDKIFGQVLGKNNKVKPEGATADSFGGLDFYKDQLNVEDNFKSTVQSASEQWLEYNRQASQLILDAAGAFNQMAVGMAGSNLMGTDGSFDFLSSGFTGATEPNQNISAIGVWDSAPNNLFDAAASASYTIQEGVNIASETLAQSGAGASDNLLGNLSKGLPGIFQGLAGVIGGQPGAGGSLFGSILGMLPKIFGFSTGGIIGSGRDRRDDQLILAQRGEAILSHQAVDLIGTGAIHQLNQGKMPKFAKGGMLVPQGLLNDGRYASSNFNQSAQPSPTAEREAVATNVTVNVTINSDGSSQTTGNTGDALGTKFVNAVKGVILQEKKPGGLIPS